MQESIRVNPSMVTKLRATFLKVRNHTLKFRKTSSKVLIDQRYIGPSIPFYLFLDIV